MNKIVSRPYCQSQAGYRVADHPRDHRLYQILFSADRLNAFFLATRHIEVQNLEYVPYMRFVLARELAQCLGGDFQSTVCGIVRDRDSGGFTIGVGEVTTQADEYVKIGTAVSHLLGPANPDAMSGTFYARFAVKHTDNSDSYLRQAYRTLALHTDGTYVDEQTDWILMMKIEEQHAVGGESRLLHLDDWPELEKFYRHALASHLFTYRSPPSKNVSQRIQRTIFIDVDGRPGICFIDQFVYPESVEQASYLSDMADSLENSPAIKSIPLRVGEMIVLNNLFWLHGRAAFERNPKLHRGLMRQRGYFSPPEAR
jgi:protein CsiD